MDLTLSLQLALEHAGSHFDAVYDITIYYEGMGGDGGRCGRAPPPDLFSKCREVLGCTVEPPSNEHCGIQVADCDEHC